MFEYPKIETLYDRNPDNMKEIIPDQLRAPEFGLVDRWLITEKIDGTNIRVTFDPESRTVTFGGRTDAASIPAFLLAELQARFPVERFEDAGLDGVTTLYGEGYGPKIQKGGGNYRDTPGFRIFDVRIGEWWLNWDNVEDVALKLGVGAVPVLGRDITTQHAIAFVALHSETQHLDRKGEDYPNIYHEGIVARTDPLLFDRRGHRVMWKLKLRDLPAEMLEVASAMSWTVPT